MAYTDDKKLEQIKRLFNVRINEVPSLAAMAQLINNISPIMVKAFLLSKIEEARQDRLDNATRENQAGADLEALKSEIGNL